MPTRTRQSQIRLIFFSLFAFLFWSGCQNVKKEAAQVDATGYSQYISAYSSNALSKVSPIKVHFATQIEASAQGEPPAELFNINPYVPGKLSWEDSQTLRFEPEANFESGQVYTCNLQLSRLFSNVPKALKTFSFEVKIKDQFIDLEMGGLSATASNDLTKQEFSGKLFTSDIAEAENVEQIVSATQEGRDLELEWEHSEDQRVHNFKVLNIQRKDEESSIVLKWAGTPIGLSTKGKKTIIIPSLNDFKIMDASAFQGQEQYIIVQFSDPLKQNQDLTGLITLNGFSGQLNFLVEGQQLRVYPSSRLSGSYSLVASPGILNVADKKMNSKSLWDITFESVKPRLRLVGNGNIIPQSDQLLFPFEAIGLNYVELEIHKIFTNNILQFLQTNSIGGNYEINRVGKKILRKRVPLQSLHPDANLAKWNRYSLDLSSLIQEEPGAIYQVTLGFLPGYAAFPCVSSDWIPETLEPAPEGEEALKQRSLWGNYYGPFGYYDGYRWEHQEDPCFPAYYSSEQFIRRNIFASNLGVIAKNGGKNELLAAVTDVRTAAPISSASIEIYDFQQQLIGKGLTDGDGIARFSLDGEPFVLLAKNGEDRAFLKLADQNGLPLSRFEVGGQDVQEGMKGYLYGERGVWRPGDSIFLNFVLEDPEQSIPLGHPINFELFNPKGQSAIKKQALKQTNAIYPFHFNTQKEDLTGNWLAQVRIGGAVFSKTLKIETIRPNRLKINLDFGKDRFASSDTDIEGKLQVNWLHGAPAPNVQTRIEMGMQATQTSFAKFPGYDFDDPARKFYVDEKVIFDQAVDSDGKATVKQSFNVQNKASGFLKVLFKTRAFEKGGGFSSDNFSIPFSPYNSYVGLEIPENQYREKRLDIGKEKDLAVVLVDEDGKPLSNKKLSIGLYKVNWRWWWDSGYDNVSRFNSLSHHNAQSKEVITTDNNGKAQWPVKVDNWGRYLVRVCDEESGHCTGDYFYAGYPWYDDEAGQRDAAAMLNFTSDKEKYNVGEAVEISIPSSSAGKCLISIENGQKVLETYWMDMQKGDNTFRFYASEKMTPNVYAHVSLIQPHAQVENDLPIRLYGVVPIMVESPDTKLSPVMDMADVLEPEQSFDLSIKEASGKPMAYTIAVVDDGLLDLTRFRTPDPWEAFYAKEALGVKTWDIYDHILGANAGQMQRILSIGGGDAVGAAAEKQSANRFKPVVLHLGPFFLESGKTARHTLKMPNYVGSVRAMVVAADQGAYGSTEKTVPVRKPLMLLASLPRVIGPEETLQMPITLFAMEDKVKNVKVALEESSGLVEIVSGNEQAITFDKPGEKLISFDLKVNSKVGIAKFKVTAEGAGEKASQEIEIDVRNPNPLITEATDYVLNPGESWSEALTPLGVQGTNSAVIEASSFPPIGIEKRLSYLIRYPHGCIEQTVSGAFPQLFVNQLTELNDEQRQKIRDNVAAAVGRLKRFTTASGGFAYWPGETNSSPWGTNYAGHFMLEAKAQGYSVSGALLNNWADYQQKMAKRWDPQLDGYRYSDLDQAYRLFTLALAEKPELGAMNRLREYSKLSLPAAWRLAAAYALSGRKEVAEKICRDLELNVSPYRELGGNYGSDLRDQAMILETLVLLDQKDKAVTLVRDISKSLSQGNWYSTQTLSYALVALCKFYGYETDGGDDYAFTYKLGNSAAVNVGGASKIYQIEVGRAAYSNQNLEIRNTGSGKLFLRLINSGQPALGEQTSIENDLGITVNFKTKNGEAFNINRIAQGADFVAEVTVKNPGSRGIRYEEMVLSQIFPSGWEILNTRMDDFNGPLSSNYDFQDIRDDRVYTYFDLNRNQQNVYRIHLNAAYQGRFYLPSIACEAMYDASINAREAGQWVEVVAPEAL